MFTVYINIYRVSKKIHTVNCMNSLAPTTTCTRCNFQENPLWPFGPSYLGLEVLLVECVGSGGVDGDHNLAAQGLILNADGVGVDEAEARKLRGKERRVTHQKQHSNPRSASVKLREQFSSPFRAVLVGFLPACPPGRRRGRRPACAASRTRRGCGRSCPRWRRVRRAVPRSTA